MRTKLTIVGIVLACLLAAAGVAVIAPLYLGWFGLAAFSAAAALVLAAYVHFIRPWQERWGATDDEVQRAMPGDDIIPAAATTTRAITIRCAPEQVWPWLVQIGYGRAGWYSYDWIDNDGRPSADRVVPELQDLSVGDRIAMLPNFGPRVVEINPTRNLLAGDVDDGTWCLSIHPDVAGCRLVSRWRQNWKIDGIASRFFVLLAGPGAFIMEQKMLRGIKSRAEAAVRLNKREGSSRPVKEAPDGDEDEISGSARRRQPFQEKEDVYAFAPWKPLIDP